jgi:hypothetical protein
MHTAKRRYRTRSSSDGIISVKLGAKNSLARVAACIPSHPPPRAGTPARSRFCNVRLAGG